VEKPVYYNGETLHHHNDAGQLLNKTNKANFCHLHVLLCFRFLQSVPCYCGIATCDRWIRQQVEYSAVLWKKSRWLCLLSFSKALFWKS